MRRSRRRRRSRRSRRRKNKSKRKYVPPVKVGRRGVLASINEFANILLRLVVGVLLQEPLLGGLKPIDGLAGDLGGAVDGLLDGAQFEGVEGDQGVDLRLIL